MVMDCMPCMTRVSCGQRRVAVHMGPIWGVPAVWAMVVLVGVLQVGGWVVVVVVVIGRWVLLRMAVLRMMPMQWAF